MNWIPRQAQAAIILALMAVGIYFMVQYERGQRALEDVKAVDQTLDAKDGLIVDLDDVRREGAAVQRTIEKVVPRGLTPEERTAAEEIFK